MNDVDFLEAQIIETMNASVEYEEHDREHQGMKVRSITLFPSIKTDQGSTGRPSWDNKLCDAIIYAYKVRLIYLESAGESKFIWNWDWRQD